MTETNLWQTKLHARLHDPAEKALVLLRDPAGHEGGSSRALWRLARAEEIAKDKLLENDDGEVLHAVAFATGIKPETYKTVQRADWWAAAADRPQWPMDEITVTTRAGECKTMAIADYARVNWASNPQLIHPLSGETYDLARHGGLADSDITDLKQRSFSHFSRLLVRDDGVTNFRKSVLSFWRFGPEVAEDDDFGTVGELWRLLPADTRVPDHSIWDHLDLTSAFAGAFAADPDGDVALLSLAIGPVQSFIEASRSTSDLWAGSHLLARLAWEAMKPVCEQFGPDAILFPRLRGIPQVDLWLRDECGLDANLFSDCDWTKQSSDANPLFGAALPNRFVAIVPAARAADIAREVESAVRGWLQNLGKKVVDELLEKAGVQGEHAYRQMQDQLDGFPEVHWAAVPFSLIRCRDKAGQRDLDTTQLSDAMRPFFDGQEHPGFLDSDAWKVLQKDTQPNGGIRFFAPNPGVLYPAVHDLAERVLAASKAVRSFKQVQQHGWRCSLTGETEWLTTDPGQLRWNKSYRESQGTLWTRLAGRLGIKKGEHLGALPAIKRVWPTLFAQEAGAVLHDDNAKTRRFVVSTHTMALAGSFSRWIEEGERIPDELEKELRKYDSVALPRKLMLKGYQHQHGQSRVLAKLPAWLDAMRDSEDDGALNRVNAQIKALLGRKPETYYALLLMDGDNMGKWLSGANAITYRDSFHPMVRRGFDDAIERQPELGAYGAQPRALSPNRHLAISAALNDFSLTVARHVIEEEFMGRLIYAGGDDVLAMLPVAELLPAMVRLRQAYSGHDPDHKGGVHKGLTLHKGFAALDPGGGRPTRLMRMMGTKATASIGAVITHHQAPLGAVLRELRTAEKQAKNEGGRDAFSLRVIKRSGGALQLTDQWARSRAVPPMTLLLELSKAFRDQNTSRRAAYNVAQWIADLPEPDQFADEDAYRSLLRAMLNTQFSRQGLEQAGKPVHSARLAENVPLGSAREAAVFIDSNLSVAEFLAREGRA